MSDNEFAEGQNPGVPEGRGPRECRSVEWYAQGQERLVEVAGMRVAVRLVGRRGRRARIAITAPPGAVFRRAGPGARG